MRVTGSPALPICMRSYLRDPSAPRQLVPEDGRFRNRSRLPITAVVTHGFRRLRAAAFAVTAAVALLGLVPVAAGTDAASPRVSVISDSVLTAVTWGNDAALSALSQG